jgi:hypothetical protein
MIAAIPDRTFSALSLLIPKKIDAPNICPMRACRVGMRHRLSRFRIRENEMGTGLSFVITCRIDKGCERPAIAAYFRPIRAIQGKR